MQTVLITGANGFVGYYLTQLLLKKGFRVIATGKGENRLYVEDKNFSYQTLDFTNDEEVEKIFLKQKPETVVHCGAISKPDECELNKENAFRTNVTGTLYLLNAAYKLRSFFVFLSTDFVFDGKSGMYKEEDARKAVNYYGETKILAEDEVMKYSFGWAIVRTVLVYGKRFLNRDNIVTNVAGKLKKGEELKIFNDQVRTPTYVEDLAAGIVSIIEKKATGIYHISGDDVLTPYEIAFAVANHLKLNSSLIQKVTEKDFDQPARRPLKTGLDISKAKKVLGYQPISFTEGLKKTLD
ncbi:MAG TPA: SDR family oxidoreductase [Flavisolibacter sp.]|nr:SDR family oxidoreductase [Flavisolibacter sp.]